MITWLQYMVAPILPTFTVSKRVDVRQAADREIQAGIRNSHMLVTTPLGGIGAGNRQQQLLIIVKSIVSPSSITRVKLFPRAAPWGQH